MSAKQLHVKTSKHDCKQDALFWASRKLPIVSSKAACQQNPRKRRPWTCYPDCLVQTPFRAPGPTWEKNRPENGLLALPGKWEENGRRMGKLPFLAHFFGQFSDFFGHFSPIFQGQNPFFRPFFPISGHRPEMGSVPGNQDRNRRPTFFSKDWRPPQPPIKTVRWHKVGARMPYVYHKSRFVHHVLCESPFISRDFYAMRPLILWHISGAYFLLIWGVGVVKIVFIFPQGLFLFLAQKKS